MFARPAILFAALMLIAACDRTALAADAPDQPAAQPAKPDFEPIKLSILPQDVSSSDGNLRLIKPGHWSDAVLESKANNFDFIGEVDASVNQSAAGDPIDLPRSPFQLQVVRPAILPKGQPKRLEFPLFVPDDCTRPWLAAELRNRGGSLQSALGSEPLSLMRPYQYFLVVLAGEPDRYRPLEALDSIRAPHSGEALHYYRVVAPPLKKPLPLPSNALAWSSIAYVIWDDVDPELLTEPQQQALVDWLHQGGQLIISGPKSLDQLGEKTFLHEYLPALPGEPLKISADTLAPLSKRWTLPVKKQTEKPLTPANPWSGVTLKPQGNAQFVSGTGHLVVEGNVGRGRIVVTAFRLSERELWDWPSFDGFVNGCLLLRPPRKFSAAGLLNDLAVNWADTAKQAADPQWVTRLRYLSRDWRSKSGFESSDESRSELTAANRDADQSSEPADIEISGPSIGGWTDFSDMANAARGVLQDAAGIVIPKSGFVMGALALYLVVLVPLNWLVFWTIGRVEWAWIAAPVIAIAGMVAVVKLAQLDIGFARSQTEIDVLEIHNRYPRGYLARYLALYTSLSTNYDVHAADPSTLILPFSADPNFAMLPGQRSCTVTYRNDPGVLLSGFTVPSNSTGLLHGEQIIDLGGAIDYASGPGDGELQNQTNLSFERAAVIRRTPQGEYQTAWIGELPSGGRAKLNFHGTETDLKWSLEAEVAQEKVPPHLNLDRLANLLRGKQHLQPGEVRLIGLIPQPLTGLTVDPEASQAPRGATLLVAFLQGPALPTARPDVNMRRDIVSARDEP